MQQYTQYGKFLEDDFPKASFRSTKIFFNFLLLFTEAMKNSTHCLIYFIP